MRQHQQASGQEMTSQKKRPEGAFPLSRLWLILSILLVLSLCALIFLMVLGPSIWVWLSFVPALLGPVIVWLLPANHPPRLVPASLMLTPLAHATEMLSPRPHVTEHPAVTPPEYSPDPTPPHSAGSGGPAEESGSSTPQAWREFSSRGVELEAPAQEADSAHFWLALGPTAEPAIAPSSFAGPFPASPGGPPPTLRGVSATTSALAGAELFQFNLPLPAPGAFYGRVGERLELVDRVSKGSSTAIVGKRWVGKSWLIKYLELVAPTHPSLGTRVRIGRLEVATAACQTSWDFVRRALQALLLPVPEQDAHGAPLLSLTLAVRSLKATGVTPVLCVDEFTDLIGKPGFDGDFLAGLRAVLEVEGLALITTSRESLSVVSEALTGMTSPLYNVMPEIVLQDFTEPEAQAFVSSKARQAHWGRLEQSFLLASAGKKAPDDEHFSWPPTLLQLAGLQLQTDKATDLWRATDATYRQDFTRRLDTQYQANM